MAEVTPQEAKENAESLRQFWQTGAKSRKRLERLERKNPELLKYPKKTATLKDEAKRAKVNFDTLAKARRVAEAYSEEDIDAWCDAIEQYRAPFSTTHLLRVLAVGSGEPRDKLMMEAITQHWTVSQLESAIQALRPRRKRVGRRPQIPDDRVQLLADLEALCLRWTRWVEAAGKAVPATLRPEVNAITNRVRNLQQAVGKKLKKLRPPPG